MSARIILTILTVITISAFTYGMQRDRPSMTAKDVVAAQLEALKNNDTPEPDSGISIAWDYAHPLNKASTGPLARFTQMLKSPAYEPLLNHRSHSITELEKSETEAAFEVYVITADGTQLKYFWVVERIDREDANSPWRTTAVSAPHSTGENLV